MTRTRSIRNVNLLYGATFLSLLGGSLLLADLSLGWRVVINQLVFLTVPLGVYLVATGQHRNLREHLRLRPVSWEVVPLSLLMGAGLWRFDSGLAVLVNSVLDYTIPLPPEALNVTVVDRVAMVVGVVLLAPVIEELLFRGVIQSVYESGRPIGAIVATSVLFVMIHQELAQSVAIVPVALALGYVTWRSGSVVPAIAIHFANNAQAMTIAALEGGRLGRLALAPSASGALVGGLIAIVALWVFTRITPPPARERERPRGRWLARHWPILPVVPIYVFAIGTGVVLGVYPEALAFGERVELARARWEEAVRWEYEIRNALDETVGDAVCSLRPDAAFIRLSCSMEQAAYEVDAPSGFFKQGPMTQRHSVRWDRERLALVGAEMEATFSEGADQVRVEAVVVEGTMVVSVDGPEELEQCVESCFELVRSEATEEVVSTAGPCRVDDALVAGGGIISPLMVGEWPWRLSALPFGLLLSREVSLVWPYRSVEGVDGRVPARGETILVVRTAEQVVTPAGEFVTWRVTVGDRYTAWYTVESPHTLVAYSDDVVTWQLIGIE